MVSTPKIPKPTVPPPIPPTPTIDEALESQTLTDRLAQRRSRLSNLLAGPMTTPSGSASKVLLGQ